MQSLYGAIANTNKKEIMVSVDDVYQKVLALANKEQRGYITPQEFNLFADQAQMDIFEQYFYDTNQFERIPGSNSTYHDMVDLIDEKVSPFKQTTTLFDTIQLNSIPNLYKLGKVWCVDAATSAVFCTVEETTLEMSIESQTAPLTKATDKRPVYYIDNYRVKLVPPVNTFGTYMCSYIIRPRKPNWSYFVHDQSALYNPDASDHQNFELDASEENKLVLKILQLAGVAIEDFNLTQMAAQKEASIIQQQKQ